MSAPPPSPAGRPAVSASTAIALPSFVVLMAIASTCVVYVAVMVVVGPVKADVKLPVPPAWLFGGLALMSITSGMTMAALLRPNENADARTWWTGVQTRLIVRAAIFESVAIFGLIARLLGASLFFGAALAALGLVLTLSLLPGLVAAKTRLDERLAKESA